MSAGGRAYASTRASAPMQGVRGGRASALGDGGYVLLEHQDQPRHLGQTCGSGWCLLLA